MPDRRTLWNGAHEIPFQAHEDGILIEVTGGDARSVVAEILGDFNPEELSGVPQAGEAATDQITVRLVAPDGGHDWPAMLAV